MNNVEDLFGRQRGAEGGEERLPSRKNVFDFIEGEALALNVDEAFATDHVRVGTRLGLIAEQRANGAEFFSLVFLL